MPMSEAHKDAALAWGRLNEALDAFHRSLLDLFGPFDYNPRMHLLLEEFVGPTGMKSDFDTLLKTVGHQLTLRGAAVNYCKPEWGMSNDEVLLIRPPREESQP